jgi:hypothetical protein
MSRLYDRVLDDCGPFRFSDLESPRTLERFLGRVAKDHLADELHLDHETDDETLGRLFLGGRVPTGVRRVDRTAFRGIPVPAADEVAAYCESLPIDTSVEDLVAPWRRRTPESSSNARHRQDDSVRCPCTPSGSSSRAAT